MTTDRNQLIISLILIILTGVSIAIDLEYLRIIFGTVTLLFVPGWWITKAFFRLDEIDILERIALSFALSIAIVPLLVFYLNLVGIAISAWLVLGVVTGVVGACSIYINYFSKSQTVVVGK